MECAFCGNEGDLTRILSFSYTYDTFDQMAQTQRVQDAKILDLVKAMENTYSIVVSADELNSHPVLQDIMEEMLQQTIQCGYFIRDYMQRRGTWYAL